MLEALDNMAALSEKAKLANVAIRDQLSAEDLMRFQVARADMIKINMFKSAESRNTRNMRLLDELARYAEIVDVDQFDPTTVKDTDPRHIYFLVLGALRDSAEPSSNGPPKRKRRMHDGSRAIADRALQHAADGE